MKKFMNFKQILFSFVFLSFFALVIPVQANSPTAKSSYIAIPKPGEVVSGQSTIILKSDKILANTTRNINLYKSDCVTLVELVSAQLVSSTSTLIKDSWDTTKYDDGDYCVSIVYGEEGNQKEDKVQIAIVNNQNNEPTLDPFSYIYMRPGVKEVFEIDTTDEDGDELSYAFLLAPDFATIDKNTGEMALSPKEMGVFNLVIKVSDGKGWDNLHLVVLNVTNEGEDELAKKVQFNGNLSKVRNEVLSGNTSITWKVQDGVQVDKQILEYSNDGVSWIQIAEPAKAVNNMKWDTEGIENGEYYLRLQLTDTNGIITQRVTKAFIANQPDFDALLYSTMPLDGSETDSKNPRIFGLFNQVNAKGATGAEIYLNGVDISDTCKVNQQSFECSPNTFPVGANKVKVVLGTQTETWTFKINDDQEEIIEITTTPEVSILDRLDSQALVLILAICGVILVLILVPWMIYFLWIRKGSKHEDEDDDYYEEEVKEIPEETVEPEVEIGTQDLKVDAPAATNPVSYTYDSTEQEVELPKWLRDEKYANTDIEDASQPVTSEGFNSPIKEIKEDIKGSQPYGVYQQPEE